MQRFLFMAHLRNLLSVPPALLANFTILLVLWCHGSPLLSSTARARDHCRFSPSAPVVVVAVVVAVVGFLSSCCAVVVKLPPSVVADRLYPLVLLHVSVRCFFLLQSSVIGTVLPSICCSYLLLSSVVVICCRGRHPLFSPSLCVAFHWLMVLLCVVIVQSRWLSIPIAHAIRWYPSLSYFVVLRRLCIFVIYYGCPLLSSVAAVCLRYPLLSLLSFVVIVHCCTLLLLLLLLLVFAAIRWCLRPSWLSVFAVYYSPSWLSTAIVVRSWA